MKASSLNSEIYVGYGKSHSSFGEIVQGRTSDGNDFLITLPTDLWSICNLTSVKRKGPLVINCDWDKSKDVALRLLDKLGIHEGYELNITFSRNIPVGKGLSSSTADMLSTVRALQENFGFLLRNNTISEVFISIEPHDGLMHKSCVIYNHRKGELIKDLYYIPAYWIVALDRGGAVDTVSFNHNLTFSDADLTAYDDLKEQTLLAFEAKDDQLIADCATKSCALHTNRTGNKLSQQMLADLKSERESEPSTYKAMGIVNTHSGTCTGHVFPRTMTFEEVEVEAEKLSAQYGLPHFITSTLKLLA